MKSAKLMEDSQEGPPGMRLPFTLAQVRKVARQSLTSYPVNKAPIQRGMSQKAAILLSTATGLFLKKIAPRVVENADEKAIRREAVVQTLLSDRKFLFSVTRIKRDEILLLSMDDSNEMSRRIVISDIERPVRFPIPFVALSPFRGIHHVSEDVASMREKEMVDEMIRALVTGNRAYQQKVPSFFKKN